MQLTLLQVPTFCLFHSYFRLVAVLRLGGAVRHDAAIVRTLVVRLIQADLWVERRVECRYVAESDAIEVTLEALVNRKLFPERAILEVACDGVMASLPVSALMQKAEAEQASSLEAAFRFLLDDMQTRQGRRLRMLDLGGRARSGVARRDHYPQCDVTTFDIVADPSVDVVGDAHALSRHFAPASFDLILCVSVFEHLLMPWKAALEMNAVLQPGGVALVHTHQTIGMHDLPWDFWRFSDTSWHGLFNVRTGFAVVEASLQGFMHVVPRVWTPRFAHAEHSGGFEGSTVIVRKTGETTLRWDAELSAILPTHYPEGPDGNG